jgi:hypothetical protein
MTATPFAMQHRTVFSLAVYYFDLRYEIRTMVDVTRWDEKAGLRRDAVGSQVIDALEAQEIRRPAMKKISTTRQRSKTAGRRRLVGEGDFETATGGVRLLFTAEVVTRRPRPGVSGSIAYPTAGLRAFARCRKYDTATT